MKPDRRTLLIGAAVIIAAFLLSARQTRRPACAGGSCGPLPLNLNEPTSNGWTAIQATNLNPRHTESTNRLQ